MKLLVTGGSGLLGSKICNLSIRRGCETYVGYHRHQSTNGIPIEFDIRDKTTVSKVINRIKPDVVIHSAALTNVDRCEEERELAWSVNVEGTKNIIENLEAYSSFFIYVSTDYVFSGEKGMYREEDNSNPVNYYGKTKLEGEKTVKNALIESCIVRPSVIFGSRPAAGKVNFVLWVLNMLMKGEPIKIIEDQWVSPTLNTNLAEIILEIVERRLKGIYHTAGATPINRYRFTNLISEIFKLDKNLITPVTSRELDWKAERPRNSTLNVEKALKTFNNKPLKIDAALSKLKTEIESSNSVVY